MKKTNSQLNTFFKAYGAYLILAGIIVLAVLFKFYHLSSLPPGLHPDEAANGMDIFRILQNHDLRIVYSTNGPREALFFYIQAGFVAVLGNTILALRVAPALFGVLAVIFVYLYTKDWFGRRTALLAAFLLAVNPWVNTVSRDGFRASMVPFMIAIVAFLGGRAYKSGKARYFVLTALFFGLGFYTYTAFALFSLVVVSGLIYIAIWRRDWIKQNAKNLLIAFAVFIITLMPLVVTVVRHPNESVFRASSTSFLNKDLNHGKPIQTFLEGTAKTLLQYNYQGDENSRHNLPGQPLLNTFVGIMFILGLLVAFSRIGRVKYAAIIAMFFVMLLPAILTAEGLPHALRSIGTVASVFTLSAIGIDYLLTRWYRTFPVNGPARSFGVVTISLLLALTAIIGWRQYFVAWAQDPQTYVAYNESAVALGDYLASHASPANYVIAGGYETLPTLYLTNKKATYILLDTKSLQDLPLATGSMQFLILADDSAKTKIDILQAKFPNGQLKPHFSSFNDKLIFYSFQVNS